MCLIRPCDLSATSACQAKGLTTELHYQLLRVGKIKPCPALVCHCSLRNFTQCSDHDLLLFVFLAVREHLPGSRRRRPPGNPKLHHQRHHQLRISTHVHALAKGMEYTNNCFPLHSIIGWHCAVPFFGGKPSDLLAGSRGVYWNL